MRLGLLALLLCLASSSLREAEAYQADAQSTAEQFKDAQNRILSEERDPRYIPWKSELMALDSDAARLFQAAATAASKCPSSRGQTPSTCEFAAQNREAVILGDFGVIAHLSDPNEIPPDADVDVIRPQIEDWYSSGFNKDRLGIAQHAGSMTAYQQDIARANLLRIRAKQSANAGDWTGAFILLRHSQLIMEALFFSVLPGN